VEILIPAERAFLVILSGCGKLFQFQLKALSSLASSSAPQRTVYVRLRRFLLAAL